MRVLIIGSGGREHAIAWACSNSKLQPEIFCLPGNGGTTSIVQNVNIDAGNFDKIVDFALESKIDLTVIGPEAPLVDGLTDKFTEAGLFVFGPTQRAAQIEGSKVFSKTLLNKCRIPTASFSVFKDYNEAKTFIQNANAPFVIKASGLAAGKGVIICDTIDKALETAQSMLVGNLFGSAGRTIVIEEFLTGREMSLLAIVDGEDYLLMPPSRDHKKIYENDQGPNTGGMGAYAPVEDLSSEQISEIADSIYPKILSALSEVGIRYNGCLYAGLMISEDGFEVLEFNCRFGDPEIQAILPLLKIDFLELLWECASGNLRKLMKEKKLTANGWEKISNNLSSVTVIAAMEGYPGKYRKGVSIDALPEDKKDLTVFHAGTKRENGNLITSGGRVLAVTGLGDTFDKARLRTYEGIKRVSFENLYYRRDIGRFNTIKKNE